MTENESGSSQERDEKTGAQGSGSENQHEPPFSPSEDDDTQVGDTDQHSDAAA